ncbi:HD-GYP domain-containing protein [Methylomagnum sp.]
MAVHELRVGMYVCELDRPWLETPFLFQGFELKSESDIDTVMQYCDYVYVDVHKTRIDRSATAPRQTGPISRRSDAHQTAFAKDMKAAGSAHKQTSSLIKSFADDIKFGTSVDLQQAKGLVSDCVSNILRNPDAMMFMTQMRNKDEELSQHAFNSCIYSIILGRDAGLGASELENLGACGLLHDMGMVSVPADVLNKRGRLSEDEAMAVRMHTRYGRDVLMSGRNVFSGTVDVAFGHHENIDGSGYPRGLTGSQLNLSCKIVSIVDKYNAITSERPYRPARNHLDAVNVLNRLAKEERIDRDLARAFINYLGVYPPGTIVELSNGELGIVIESNPEQRLRPQLLIVRDAEGNSATSFVDMVVKPVDEQGRPYKIKQVHPAGAFGIDLNLYQVTMLRSLE